jgi:3-phosphoshikimate 1-carboxyvinyltransferase
MPLVTKTELWIEDPEVVNKSYPSFWKQVEHAGIRQEILSPTML